MNRKKLVYSILKELERGNKPKREDYELEMEQWGEIALLLRDEGYAKNIGVFYADDAIYSVIISDAKITMKGLKYLEENSLLAKSYRGLKEVREWLKV